MSPILIGALAGAAVLVVGIWLFSRAISSNRFVLNEVAATLPLDLAASIHDHVMLLIQTETGISAPRWKVVEKFAEIAASIRYSIGLRTESSFSIRDKGRYRTGLTFVAVKLSRLKLEKVWERHQAETKALDPFRIPQSIARGQYEDALLEEHIEGMAAKLP